MTRRLLTLCLFWGAAAAAFAQNSAADRAQQELGALREAYLYDVDLARRAAAEALRDARVDQERLAVLEYDLQRQVVREESLIHRDRRIIVELRPGAATERLAVEQEKVGAARRLGYGSGARFQGYGRGWRGGTHAGRVTRATRAAFDAVETEFELDERRRQEIIHGVLDLADQMEREARQEARKEKGQRKE